MDLNCDFHFKIENKIWKRDLKLLFAIYKFLRWIFKDYNVEL
ncbi:hypothetical protein ED5_0065 [Enterobacter roggenkampii]|nr:hypothetical protein ED5_0065 [Enterobacter roggenkampii]